MAASKAICSLQGLVRGPDASGAAGTGPGIPPQGLPGLHTSHSQSCETDARLGTGPGQDLCQTSQGTSQIQ